MKSNNNQSWKELSNDLDTDIRNLILKHNKNYSKELIFKRFKEYLKI